MTGRIPRVRSRVRPSESSTKTDRARRLPPRAKIFTLSTGSHFALAAAVLVRLMLARCIQSAKQTINNTGAASRRPNKVAKNVTELPIVQRMRAIRVLRSRSKAELTSSGKSCDLLLPLVLKFSPCMRSTSRATSTVRRRLRVGREAQQIARLNYRA